MQIKRSQIKLVMRLGLMCVVGLFGLIALTVLSRAMAGITRSEETAAIFNVSAKLPHDLVGAVEWLPDASTNPRELPTLTREAITDAWLRGWAQISILSDGSGPVGSSVEGENTDGLIEYFSGPAYDALLAAAPEWLGLPVHQIGHDLQLTFYADDGSLATVSSRSTRLLRSQPFGDGLEWYDADETYDAVFVLQDGAWRMHHWVRTSATGRWGTERATPARVAFEPDELRAIDYEPRAQTAEEFWDEIDRRELRKDMAIVRELGFTAVRLDLPFEVLGGRDVEPEDLDTAVRVLDEAQSQGLDVILGLLEGRREHQPLHWDADDDHIQIIMETLGDHPALVLWDLKSEPDLDIGQESVDQQMLHTWLAHIARTAKAADPDTPVTIGWATPRAAAEAPPIVDVISFAYTSPETLDADLLEIRATSGDQPILFADASYHTHMSILPGGQTDLEQAHYFANMKIAAAEHDIDGYTVSTLWDFDIEPVAERAQALAEKEDADEKAKIEERAAMYPTTPTPEPKELGPEVHETPIVADVTWPTGADAQMGLLLPDGTPKPAAVVFAPEADLDALPTIGRLATIKKPFNVILLFLAGSVVGLWGFLALWDRDRIPIPKRLRWLLRKRRERSLVRRLIGWIWRSTGVGAIATQALTPVFRLVKQRALPVVLKLAPKRIRPVAVIVTDWIAARIEGLRVPTKQQLQSSDPRSMTSASPPIESSPTQYSPNPADPNQPVMHTPAPAQYSPYPADPNQHLMHTAAQVAEQQRRDEPISEASELAAEDDNAEDGDKKPGAIRGLLAKLFKAPDDEEDDNAAAEGELSTAGDPAQQPGYWSGPTPAGAGAEHGHAPGSEPQHAGYPQHAMAPAAPETQAQPVAPQPFPAPTSEPAPQYADAAHAPPVSPAQLAAPAQPPMTAPAPYQPEPVVQTYPHVPAEPAVVQQSSSHLQPAVAQPPAVTFGAEHNVGGVQTITVDFEAIETALRKAKAATITWFGADRYLPFVVRAVTITASRYQSAVRAQGAYGQLSVMVRSVHDGVEHDLYLDDAGNRRIVGIAADLHRRSQYVTASDPDAASLLVVALGHSGPGERLYANPSSYPLVVTLTNVAVRPAVSTDVHNGVVLSMHNMGTIGLAWRGHIDPRMCDGFMADLKYQLEHRDWSTELD